MNPLQTRLYNFFSDSKNWAAVYLFTIYMDTLMTLVGTHQQGFTEANPIIKEALITGNFKLPLLSAASILLVMFLVIKCWNINTNRGEQCYLSRTSMVLRLTAWLLIPTYFYFTSFGWMYMLSYNTAPPLHGYFLTVLERLL